MPKIHHRKPTALRQPHRNERPPLPDLPPRISSVHPAFANRRNPPAPKPLPRRRRSAVARTYAEELLEAVHEPGGEEAREFLGCGRGGDGSGDDGC